MKIPWWKLLAAIGLGFLGGVLATLVMRIEHDPSLLINSDVIGAAIGAALTIGATLIIENLRRRAERLNKLIPLKKALRAMKGVVETGLNQRLDGMNILARAEETATVYGALGGARETLDFARSRADIHDPWLWMHLEQLERAFKRFEEQRAAAKDALIDANLTEAAWATADERLKAFCASAAPRIAKAFEAIDRAG